MFGGLRTILIAVAAITALGGVGVPMISALGDSGNDATRLVDATEKTSNKADSLDDSYNDVIPRVRPSTPPDGTPAPGAGGTGVPEEEAVAIPPGYDPDHPVLDAMNLMNEIHREFGPRDTEYVRAVEVLKSTWEPRYERAMLEYERFERRVVHARRMAYRYMETQHNLTQSYNDEETRRAQERRDYYEQKAILEWVAGAEEVLGQARSIKNDLTDMNTTIVKLELSANFKSVYQDFAKIPLSMTLLNEELETFRMRSDEIYEQFGEAP